MHDISSFSERVVTVFQQWLNSGVLRHTHVRLHEAYLPSTVYIPRCSNTYNNLCQHDLVELYLLATTYDVRLLRSATLALLQDEVVQMKRNNIEITAALHAYNNLPEDSPLIKYVTACIIYGWPKYFKDFEYKAPKVPLELLEKLPPNVLLSAVRKQVTTGFGTSGIQLELDRAVFEGITAPGLYAGNSNAFRPDEHALHEHETEEELEECEAFLASDNHGMERWKPVDLA